MSGDAFRARLVALHLHPHPNFIIRDVDADAGPLPSLLCKLPFWMKFFCSIYSRPCITAGYAETLL